MREYIPIKRFVRLPSEETNARAAGRRVQRAPERGLFGSLSDYGEDKWKSRLLEPFDQRYQIQHAFVGLAGGSIVVRLAEQDDSLYIEIEDDGRGLPHDFDPDSQGGLGLQIVRSLVREDLKGQFELANGQGVRAVVSFPKWISKAE